MSEQRPSSPSVRPANEARRPGMPQPTHIGKIEKARDPRSALTRLLPYLQPFRGQIRWVLLLVVSYTFLGLVGPYLMGVAIDHLLRAGQLAALAHLALAMLAVYLLYNVLQAIAGRLMADVSQRALKQLRADLFNRVQRLPVSFFGEGSTGDLLSRLTNDVEAINQAVSQNVTTLVASLLSMLGIIVAMFLLDRWLALASLLVLPIMFWFTQFVARYTRKGFRDLQRDLGQLNGVMEEAISGQKTAQAFRRKQSQSKHFSATISRCSRRACTPTATRSCSCRSPPCSVTCS